VEKIMEAQRVVARGIFPEGRKPEGKVLKFQFLTPYDF